MNLFIFNFLRVLVTVTMYFVIEDFFFCQQNMAFCLLAFTVKFTKYSSKLSVTAFSALFHTLLFQNFALQFLYEQIVGKPCLILPYFCGRKFIINYSESFFFSSKKILGRVETQQISAQRGPIAIRPLVLRIK